jgi:hypothetical protein
LTTSGVTRVREVALPAGQTVGSGSSMSCTPVIPPADAAVVHRDHERPRRVEHELADAARDPRHRLVGERLLAIEDRRARDRPVDALGGGPVRLRGQSGRASAPARRIGGRRSARSGTAGAAWSARRSRTRAAAATRRRSRALELADERAERLAFARDRGGWPSDASGPQSLELLDVLERDHARLDRGGPAHRDPGEPADLLLARLAALRLEWCLQSGENHASATGLPRTPSTGSTSQTFSM